MHGEAADHIRADSPLLQVLEFFLEHTMALLGCLSRFLRMRHEFALSLEGHQCKKVVG